MKNEKSFVSVDVLLTEDFVNGPQGSEYYNKIVEFQEPKNANNLPENIFNEMKEMMTEIVFPSYKNALESDVNDANEWFDFHYDRGELFEQFGYYEKALHDYDCCMKMADLLSDA